MPTSKTDATCIAVRQSRSPTADNSPRRRTMHIAARSVSECKAPGRGDQRSNRGRPCSSAATVVYDVQLSGVRICISAGGEAGTHRNTPALHRLQLAVTATHNELRLSCLPVSRCNSPPYYQYITSLPSYIYLCSP